MHPLFRLAAAGAFTLAALSPALAQTPPQVPGNDGSPPQLSTHRDGTVPTVRPTDTVQEVTQGVPTGDPPQTAHPAEPSGTGVLRRVTAENHAPTREEVMHESAAMNHADAIPRGELSVAPRAGAPEGGFLRKF